MRLKSDCSPEPDVEAKIIGLDSREQKFAFRRTQTKLIDHIDEGMDTGSSVNNTAQAQSIGKLALDTKVVRQETDKSPISPNVMLKFGPRSKNKSMLNIEEPGVRFADQEDEKND